ncbi:N-acyl-D-amino-acid deacylase family protein [Autumnicola musiva]|uniref:Amidohydrolase family protein n=1 Tax=Autumnicola musiva TaxID=3075589 RepID=A0ABU3D8V8_9FLAO|nr:amidohydrolase family protein [Zunongwangia sp. F117]MDT0677966.1 amidohydrolase family protein [Zunongwangia sp. F117]
MKKKIRSLSFSILAALIGVIGCANAQISQPDLLITGAKVFIDKETGFKNLDVGVKNDKIMFLGNAASQNFKTTNIIKAEGKILSPGFIDPHTHLSYDLSREDRKANLPYLMQGVTTIVTGNDGSSPLPIGEKLDEWQKNGIGTNAALLVGHGSVRKEVLGLKDVQPNDQELNKMKDLVAKAMQDGAYGISTGLFYSPGSYSETKEIIELSKVASEYGGIYDTHMRDESSYTIGLIKSVEEILEIAEKADIPVHISHIKALGKDVWGKSAKVIKMVEEAQEKGLEVTANQYPYPASRTNLIAAVIPRWAEDGGYDSLLKRFQDKTIQDSLQAGIKENIRRRGGPETLIFSSAEDEKLNGLSLEEIAENWELTPTEAVIKALKADGEIRVVSYNMTEEDLNAFMQQDWVMTGSDGTPGHPRKYGSFSTKMRKYYKEDGIIDLPFLLHNQSVQVAETFGFEKRGKIEEGNYADLILFDPDKVIDHATFDEPSKLASGMSLVIVNGEIAVKDGEFTGKLPGKALRHINK